MSHFPVTSSTLSPAHLARFLQEHYTLSENVSCGILKTGINDTYLVNTSAGKFVFRIYSLQWRSVGEIAEELRLIGHLKANNISLSYPIPNKNGTFIEELNAPEGTRYGVLFSYAKGEKLHNYDPAQHYKLGMLMAQMHQLTENYELARPRYDVNSLVLEPMEEIKNFLPNDTVEMGFLKKAQQYLLDEFDKVNESDLRKGALHLDIWFDNINIDSQDNITIFDFDFCGNGWLCLDIAYYIMQLQYVERDENECKLKTGSFLQGYTSIRNLSSEERRIIPMLGLSLYFFYMGTQCRRFDNWSNVFLNETYLKRYIMMIVKRYADINGLNIS